MPRLRRESVAARVEEELRAAADKADREHAARQAREELKRVQRLVLRGKWRQAAHACSDLTDQVCRVVIFDQKFQNRTKG